MNLNLRIGIIGAGMAGMLAGIRLAEKGFKNIVIYEKANNVGGTWRDNTYPGLICDVPSHHYTYSFARKPNWSRHYSSGKEIQDYFEEVAKEYQLDQFIEFNQEVSKAEFQSGQWILELKQGKTDRVDILIPATGVLHHPKYPDIEGFSNFNGKLFHSSRWDHSIDLSDKKVGVIGNGSSGVQIVSALGGKCNHLYHFQRTAQWMMPLENGFFTKQNQQAFRDPQVLDKAMQFKEYFEAVERYSEAILDMDSAGAQEMAKMCLNNLEDNVHDPKLKEALRPNHQALCKRLIWSSDYYPAVQQENVSLITNAIQSIDEDGINLDKEHIDLDVIVFATGYKVDSFMRPMKIIGSNNITLDKFWSEYPIAYLSICMPHFPNLFMLNGPNGPVGNFSLIDIAEHQMHYIFQLLKPIALGKFQSLHPSEEATYTYEKLRSEAAKKTVWFKGGCTSWYLNDLGIPASWPWTYSKFVDEMDKPNWEHFKTA